MKSYCATCNYPTNHKVLHEEKDFADDDGGWWQETLWQIVKCGGCDAISFRKLYDDIQLHQFRDEGKETYVQTLYPARSKDHRTIKTTKNLPVNLTGIYRETIDAFNNRQYILCSGGLRALIEGICIDKGIEGEIKTKSNGKNSVDKSLAGKINGLSANRFLTSGNCAALHELRFLGNSALHELSPPTIEELNTAIDIIEHTLTNIYELSHHVLMLKRRASARKAED